MRYPKFLNNKSTIGVTAPSMGIGSKEKDYELSINNLSKHFNIIETKSVRNDGLVSNTNKIRAKELDELITNNMLI